MVIDFRLFYFHSVFYFNSRDIINTLFEIRDFSLIIGDRCFNFLYPGARDVPGMLSF